MKIKMPPKKWLITAAATATIASSALGIYVWHEEHRPAILELYIFNLKSGRSMFIRTPDDQRILLDGGANSEIISRLTAILPFYSRRIDTLIVTNDFGQNVSGLIDVLERYQVEKVVLPKITSKSLGLGTSTDRIYETFLDRVASKKLPPAHLGQGDFLVLGQDVRLEAFFPAPAELFEYSKASAPELLFNISYGSTTISFMGSASKKVQHYIAAENTHDPVDVLIVSSSASPSNVSANLVQKLRPTYLLYSKSRTAVSRSKGNSTTKKPIKEPLQSVAQTDRFNLKDFEHIHITSNGAIIKIAPQR